MTTLTYIDGSNNRYEILGNTLSYTAVAPSSFLTNRVGYSGGKSEQLPLVATVIARIEQLASLALNDKDAQLSNRPKGSGTLIYKNQEVVLSMNSPCKINLEQALRDLLNQ